MKTRRELLVGLGAILAAPGSAFAQKPGKVWRVGVAASRRGPGSAEWDMFYSQVPRRLRELGWVEGTDLVFEWRFAGGDYARLPELAAELVKANVDLIVTDGSQGIRATQAATKTIPIVFNGGSDLVASGFVKSLSRPGGNTTGVSLLLSDTAGKQVELVLKMVPKISRLAVLTNPGNPAHASLLTGFRNAVGASGPEVVHLDARSPKEIEEAGAQAVREKAGALLWTVDSFFIQQQRQIAQLAAMHRLPSMSGVAEYPEVGGLMGYGPDRRALWRRVAEYVDRILKGSNPGDLPVEQPSKLDLVLNRTTARALGLAIPPELLVQADRIID